MAITNHERVGKGLALTKTGLRPFIERELKSKYGDQWVFEVRDILQDGRLGHGKGDSHAGSSSPAFQYAAGRRGALATTAHG